MNSNSAIPLAGFKQSGIGAEMGYPGIEDYTKAKSVVIDLIDVCECVEQWRSNFIYLFFSSTFIKL